MSVVTILVGAQWGDEGKGKWIDILADRADYVVRFQGGNNAGHTLYVDGEKVVLHQIPSGIFQPNMCSALAAGVVVNPVQLVDELQKIRSLVTLTPGQLLLSPRAHVISPWHIQLDSTQEAQASKPIGTTKRGIGPTYAHKATRLGLRLGHYVDDQLRREWMTTMAQDDPAFADCLRQQAAAWEAFHAAAATIAPYVADVETHLRQAMTAGKRMLMEGAQGALLDLNHGTYPFVTSSSTCAGGACSSVGFSPKYVGKIYGVAKAYLTRVGAGAFPTELNDAAGQHLAKVGHEFGATTGRPRRCGWLDAVALRYSMGVNGFESLILNKLDVLTGLKEIKIAVAYQHPKLGRITDFPWDEATLAACTPVYESFSGWDTDIPKHGNIDNLPAAARDYVAAVARIVGCKIEMVGTGVNRGDALYL